MDRKKLSEELLKDLYLNLRSNLLKWSKLTNQTPQARMGYVGQHLTSIVTGYAGGKSGARGRDLIINKDEFGEIKTCYRIDQLGVCISCQNQVASFELKCSICNSNKIDRKDDSKWLITIKDEEELREIFKPKFYYLVLFEFVDFNIPKDINVSIFKVNPNTPGFSLCMIDYFFNIKSKSKSKAPFNLWPHQFKYYLMQPSLIYHSVLKYDNSIETKIFPTDVNSIKQIELLYLNTFSRATTLSSSVIENVYKLLKIQKIPKNKNEALTFLTNFFKAKKFTNIQKTDLLSNCIYLDTFKNNNKFIPSETKESINNSLTQIQNLLKD